LWEKLRYLEPRGFVEKRYKPDLFFPIVFHFLPQSLSFNPPEQRKNERNRVTLTSRKNKEQTKKKKKKVWVNKKKRKEKIVHESSP